jgi:hypothetical protein
VKIDELWPKIRANIINSPRKQASTIEILRDHIDENQDKSMDAAFLARKHYFQVLINEMYLGNEREWLHKVDPVVYVVSEFTYAGKPQTVPFLVGPSLLKEKGIPDKYASGMVIRNTSVSGLHPYRGGGLTLTISFCEARGDNLLRPLLQVIESTAKALDFSPILSPYTKIAEVLMSGFESLFNAGGLSPFAGLRDSFGPNINVFFRPAYFAIIDEEKVDQSKLWVKEKQLMKGSSLATATPYRDADFVLYSFVSPTNNERDDLDNLPFNPLWQRVRGEAKSPIDDPNYKNARILMANLDQEVSLSPDLTEAQAESLVTEYYDRIHADHELAKRRGAMGEEKDTSDEGRRRDEARKRALKNLLG